MRKALQLRRWMILCGLVLSLGLAQAQVVRYTIDPNGDTSPEAVKNLQLSFRLNTVDIMAPSVLITPDGSIGFANYIKSEADEMGYVLVFRPEAAEPADRIVTAIQVGLNPAMMFFNPTFTEIWIVNLGDFGIINNDACSIAILDVNTLTVAATIPAPDYGFGFGSNVVFSQDGAYAFLSSTYSDEIVKIDTTTRQVAETLKLVVANPYYYTSVGPAWLTLSHDGTFLCSTNTFNETVSVVSTGTLAEVHQIHFRDPTTLLHVPNFTFRNNVLLNDDDTIGFIASIGASTTFGVADRVYEFDPVAGEKLKDEDDNDIYLLAADNPSTLALDPTGQYLVVQVTSYEHVDNTGTQLSGYPAVYIYTWPDLQLYKVQTFRSPNYNMTRSGSYAFMPNGDGTYDLLLPSFSTYYEPNYSIYEDNLLRVPIALHENTASLGLLETPAVRDMPVTVVAIPGTTDSLVANFLTGALTVCSTPPVPKFSNVISMFIEDNHFSSLALLNRLAEPVTFQLQSYQSNNTSTTDDDDNAGIPFYYVENSEAKVISPYDLTLQPGQQLVTMFQGLVPDYSKVVGQHGFSKVAHPSLRIEGIGFNGALNTDGTLVRGDYLRINQPMYQDAIFPYLYSVGDIQLYLHYVNPYYNQYDVQRFTYTTDGIPIGLLTTSFTLQSIWGIDQLFEDTNIDGYIRIFNRDNVNTDVYMTIESKLSDSPFLFACPPLNPQLPSSTQSFHIPYFAVGESYDTAVVLVSINTATDPEEEDEEGNPIRLKTHVRFDFYDLQGQLTVTKEFDFNNMARLEKYFSAEDMLNVDRFGAGFTVGSVVVTVDRDNVCGVYAYSQWNTFDPDEDPPLHPFKHIRNMTVDELPLTQDAADSLIFPFTINIAPFDTSYAINNPGTEPATVRVELYQGDGTLLAESPADITVAPGATFLFFLGDPAVFGDVTVVENFVGYMQVVSTNGQPIIGKSIQSSPDMMSIIPTL